MGVRDAENDLTDIKTFVTKKTTYYENAIILPFASCPLDVCVQNQIEGWKKGRKKKVVG